MITNQRETSNTAYQLKKMAVSVGSKVNTPFGSGVVCNKRKDGGVDVVSFLLNFLFFFDVR